MSALDALQAALAAEHAAVYVYGVLGAQTSQTSAPTLFGDVTAAYTTHRDRRDQLVGLVTAAGGTPVASAPSYALPDGLGTPAGVSAAALALERACARTYVFLVASSEGDVRRAGVGALTDAAVRELGFGGSPETLPGADTTA